MEFRLLRADEIDCKIKTCASWGVMLLLYKDARCDMNILDESVGSMNWQRKHELINGNLFCSVGIRDENGWTWKQDVGVESYTEKEKGEASDSFKRACFNWGIGRELYTAPRMNVYAKDLKTLKDVNGKWVCNDFFTVQDIQYNGRKICFVRIRNEKTGQDISFGTPAGEEQRQKEIAYQCIGEDRANVLRTLLMQKQVDEHTILDNYHVSKLEDLNEEQHGSVVRRLAKSSGGKK